MGTRPSRLETNHFYPTRKTRFECQMSLNYFIGLVNCACEESSSLFQTSVFMVIKLAQRVAWRYRVFVLFLRSSLVIFYLCSLFPTLASILIFSRRKSSCKIIVFLASVSRNMLNLFFDFPFNNRILQLVVANRLSTEGSAVDLWGFTCCTLLGICTVSVSLLKTLRGMSPQLQLDISRNKRGCKQARGR